MRGEGAETFQFVHKSQLEHLCLAVVFCLPRSLPLRLPQHFPQNGTSWLRGEEGVIKWWVLTARAELKNWAGAGRGGRFGTRGVGRSGGLEEEAVWAFYKPPGFGFPW